MHTKIQYKDPQAQAVGVDAVGDYTSMTEANVAANCSPYV